MRSVVMLTTLGPTSFTTPTVVFCRRKGSLASAGAAEIPSASAMSATRSPMSNLRRPPRFENSRSKPALILAPSPRSTQSGAVGEAPG